MMKIAYITQSFPPMISGAALIVARLARDMAAHGHSTLVIAASDRGHAYTIEDENSKIVRLASIHNPKRAYQQFVPGSFRRIDREIKAFQPDLIHLHDVLFLGVAGVLAGRATNTPVIATIHQLPWFVSAYLPSIPGLKPSIESLLWLYSRWLGKQCERLIVPTYTISQTIAQKGGLRTTVISNGVDLKRFSPIPLNSRESQGLRDKLGLDPGKPTILHVGRLDVDKRVDIVIQAAAKAMGQIDSQLLVVGDGECRQALIKLADRSGIMQRSFFPGFMDPMEDIPRLYRIGSVFTTASEIETQGLVLLEAIASGLPIVAVDATCIPEVVKNNRNGFLVPPGDTNALANKLVETFRNPSRAREMGQVGRGIAQSHSIEVSLNQHEDLYRSIATSGASYAGPAPLRSSRSFRFHADAHGTNGEGGNS